MNDMVVVRCRYLVKSLRDEKKLLVFLFNPHDQQKPALRPSLLCQTFKLSISITYATMQHNLLVPYTPPLRLFDIRKMESEQNKPSKISMSSRGILPPSCFATSS